MNRRAFIGAVTAGSLRGATRKDAPHEALRPFAVADDEFPGEKEAARIAAHLDRLFESRSVPVVSGLMSRPPRPARYRRVANDVRAAEFASETTDFKQGLGEWIESLGKIRVARFFPLADGVVRFEIAAADGYHVGHWRIAWLEHRVSSFEPLDEIVTNSPASLFRDVSSHVFARTPSFHEQLLKGVPYWRARLDAASGIDVYGSNGVAVGDIENSGFDAVYVCQPGGLPNRLYRNHGDGTFEDITDRAGVGLLDETSSALFVDVRNSGRQDLIVLRSVGPLLYLNQGDGTFKLAPDAFQFATRPQGSFTGMAAADYDNDGLVDVYLCSYIYFQSEDQYRYPAPYHDARNGPPNFLFRNMGNGVFRDVTAQTGMDHNNNRYSFAAAWCDYNGDGFPDLYVANDFGRKNLYRNEGGRFRDVAAEAGVEDIGPGMSAAWFDYDGDGRQDLYVANMWSPAGQRVVKEKSLAPAEAYRRHSKGNSLYRNRGDGRFDETSAAQGVEMGRWAWSADAADFDNDGSPEIYVTAGMLTNSSSKDLMSFFWRRVVSKSGADYERGWNTINQLIREDYSWNGREPNVYYARRGGRYYDFSGVSGLDFADDSRAFAVTDFDGDGNLDVILKSRLGPQVRVLRNYCGVGRNAIAFRLRGVKSNRDAMGARVEVDGAVKYVRAGSGYLSQHTKTLHFGLDENSAAKVVRVHWPSGAVQEFHDCAAGYRYDIEEGSADLKRTAFKPRREMSDAALVAYNQPRESETWFIEPVPLPEKRTGPGFLAITTGQPVPRGVVAVDLTMAGEDTAALYGLFRRYLFDWRTDLKTPVTFLLDERGAVRKFYPGIPSSEVMRADLTAAATPLPFAGHYHSAPSRSYFKLGAAFFWAGYADQALRYFDEAVRRAPDNEKALLAIGQIHLEAKRLAEAGAAFQRVVALNPQSADAWNGLGGVEADDRLALGRYEKALAVRPGFVPALLNAARVHARLGDTASAERLLRGSADADAANQLGLLYAKANRHSEARQAFQDSIAARRDHAGAINNLGVLYGELRQFNDAIAAFQYGIEVAPDDDTLYMNLGRVYVATGEREKARETMRRLLARKPGHAAARKALDDLAIR